MIQGGGNSGAEMQPSRQPGSPTGLEVGQANGAEATSPTGMKMQVLQIRQN